jgi:molybdate transport system substrate-binding protein
VIPAGFAAEKLVTGEADLAVQQASELLVVPGIEVVGKLPEELSRSRPSRRR